MVKRIEVLKAVCPANFTEEAYLAANPGVRAAVARGAFESGRHHFDTFGKNESRRLFSHELIPEVIDLRRKKLSRLQNHLDWSLPHSEDQETGQIDFLNQEVRENFNIAGTENVSGHQYDSQIIEIIEENADGLVLDCGAGLRSTYYENVVNFEIAPYYSTDIFGVGEQLPFLDNSFDAVLSLAVLEHVSDPFVCARELTRVLKPGGTLLSQVPFLQEFHAFPHHYFNMTTQGHRRLFEDQIDIDVLDVPLHMWPIKALLRFLRVYWGHLDPADRQEFGALTVKDIIARDFQDHCKRPYAENLSKEAREILACASLLIGRKKRSLND